MKNAMERREAVLERLRAAQAPVSAAALARQFSVSRQIIVGDVALLRAAGADITATPRGYVLGQGTPGLVCTVACWLRCMASSSLDRISSSLVVLLSCSLSFLLFDTAMAASMAEMAETAKSMYISIVSVILTSLVVLYFCGASSVLRHFL